MPYIRKTDEEIEAKRELQRFHREKILARKYGVSVEELAILRKREKCAICNVVLTSRKGSDQLVIDHNHETGKIRDVLCTKCNMDVGKVENLGDKIELLRDYIEKHDE